LRCIYRERAGISLYDALHDSAPGSIPYVFSPEIIAKVSKTLTRFAHICKGYQVPEECISVFATEAMRTAHNRDAMLAAIKSASGLSVQILSPAMESLFGAMGARSAFGDVDGLFMDLGGGSVQMTYLNSKIEGYEMLAAGAATSMPYGAAKLTAVLKTEDAHETRKDLKTQMRDRFEDMKERFPKLKEQAESEEGVSIYFCGGGFRGYGSILKHTHEIQPYPIPAIGGFTVSGAKFMQWREMLKENEKEGKIFGMSKRRREQFPAIAMVVGALVEAVPKVKRVTFCSGGNRDGVLYMKLPPKLREQHPLPVLPGGLDGLDSATYASIDSIADVVVSTFPEGVPEMFSSHLLKYIIRNTWVHMGHSDDENSAKAIHNPISGAIAGLPGLTHEVQAIISLVLCARWGTSLGPMDKVLYDNLRLLVGKKRTFWSDYIGAVMRFLAAVFPVFPAEPQELSILA
jgi:retrograde regulation protein 2